MTTKEQRREYSRSWAEKNKEKVKEIKRRWRERNKDAIRLKRMNERLLNREARDKAKRLWEKENPEMVAMQKIRKRLRDMQMAHGRALKFSYNITAAQFSEIAEAQGFVCAICNTHDTTAKSKRLFVDHDHETGRLRALLCHRCNSGLGYFKDSLSLMRRAIAYLEAFDGIGEPASWPDQVRGVLESLPATSGEERRGKILVEAKSVAEAFGD